MAKKKKQETPAVDLAGTVEGLAAEHFEREKAAYEERTGEKVHFVPPVPLTRTPIGEPQEDEQPADSTAEGEGEV